MFTNFVLLLIVKTIKIMKKVLLIMIMLVMSMGVSFTTNAQGETLPYSMDENFIDTEGWSVTLNGFADQPIHTHPYFTFSPIYGDGDVTMQKYFDLENMDSLDISFSFSEITSNGYDVTFSVYIDGVLTPINYTANNMTSTVTITNNTSFTSNSSIEIVIDFVSQGSSLMHRVEVNIFDVTGYENTGGGVGISDNELSDNLEIYSYNKSVFLSSSENVNANITVYNMSGQVVSNENMNISSNKT